MLHLVRLLPVAALVAACQLLPGLATGGPYPDACAGLGFEPRRCEAIVDKALVGAGLEEDRVVEVFFLPDPGEAQLGGLRIATIRFRLNDGGEHVQEVWCVGVGSLSDRACQENPVIPIWAGVDRDVPCSDAGCITSLPSFEPEALAAARPLRVVALDVPLDHPGPYAVDLGRAIIPNGVLSERSLTLAESSPSDFWIDDGVRLEVRSLDDGAAPFGNIYARGWHTGAEEVEVRLTFTVTELTPGAVLQVRDVVVR